MGGGFVLDEDEAGHPVIVEDRTPVRYPFSTGAELLARTHERGMRISDVMLANELSWHSETQIRDRLLHIWLVMQECVERGIRATGVLPGGLSVKAIIAARMAVRGDGRHHVPLDKTMRETGADMKDKYKETARGGLALNIVEC